MRNANFYSIEDLNGNILASEVGAEMTNNAYLLVRERGEGEAIPFY